MGVKRPKPSGEIGTFYHYSQSLFFFVQILFRKQLILHKGPSMGWVGGWFEVVQQKTVKDYFGSDSSNQSTFSSKFIRLQRQPTQIYLIWNCYKRKIE